LEFQAAHVLIVDDQPINAAALKKILSQIEEIRFSVALNGNEAVDAIKADTPDIILLDVLMPGMDGFELCKKIKNDPASAFIPVIFITSLNDAESIERGFDSGGIDYISKPFNPREVKSRVRAHLESKIASDRLAALSVWKDRLLSILSHDMRGPVGNLALYTQMLEKELGETSPYFSDSFKKIKNSISSVTDLMENLLQWSVLQSSGASVRREKFTLKSLIDRCIGDYGAYASDKNIVIKSDFSDDIEITADSRLIEIIVRNFIRNALKFTASGFICVKASIEGALITISVEDTGIGMDPAMISRIMESREVLSTAGTMKEKGSGVGLMICKDLAAVCGGKISVKSKLGEGSEFSFTFAG